jgi:stage III sporulation protein AA
LLRDIVRQISDGGLTVGLVDERSEVAGCYRGVPQNDVGLRTDVLDGCPKAQGMVMLLRAMSPQVIAVDELGGEADAKAVADVLNAGVKLLCTAHGQDMEDLKRSPMLKELIGQNIFERYVVLKTPKAPVKIYDGQCNQLTLTIDTNEANNK